MACWFLSHPTDAKSQGKVLIWSSWSSVTNAHVTCSNEPGGNLNKSLCNYFPFSITCPSAPCLIPLPSSRPPTPGSRWELRFLAGMLAQLYQPQIDCIRIFLNMKKTKLNFIFSISCSFSSPVYDYFI